MSTWEKLPLGLYKTQVPQNAQTPMSGHREPQNAWTPMSGHRGVAWLWEACALLTNALGLNKALRSPSHFGQSKLHYRILWPRREALLPEVLLVRGRRGCGGEISPTVREDTAASPGRADLCASHTPEMRPLDTPPEGLAPLGREERLKMWAGILCRHQEAGAETEGLQTFRWVSHKSFPLRVLAPCSWYHGISKISVHLTYGRNSAPY